MNLAMWAILGVVGFAVLFVTIRMAGLDSAPARERRPRWLLVLGVAEIVIGFIVLVVAARSDR